MRVIDADELVKKALTEACFDSRTEDVFLDLVDAQPTTEAEPVRHRKWKVAAKSFGFSVFRCSECGRTVSAENEDFWIPTQHISERFPYCHCGAKMDGGVSSEG